MTKTATLVALAIALTLGHVTAVAAQTQPVPPAIFVNINAGAQPATHTFTTGSTFPIYGETATWSADGHVGNGPLFDVNGGWMSTIMQLGVAAGFSTFSDNESGAVVTASIPHPLIVNSLRSGETSIANMRHSERAGYFQVVYRAPVRNKIDVTVGLGPTFIRVKQDLISGVTVPLRTQDFTPVLETQSKTAVGIVVGFDASYMFMPRVGAGLFVRYAGAKADLPAVPDLKVGGLQAGLGIRLRY
jgi:hypothetical protein